MLLKPRSESRELLLLRSLNSRFNLSIKDKQYYLNLEKGFEGEIMFDLLFDENDNKTIMLNDLLLIQSNSKFQIDSIYIHQLDLFMFEVKNYDGDFIIKNDRWYSPSGTEIKNPLLQLMRSETLLRQLVHDLGYKFTIKPYIIFINPEFTLYNAPTDSRLIFPTQINRFMTKLNTSKTTLINEKQQSLAQSLISHNLDDYDVNVPSYSFEKLKKGIFCRTCNTLLTGFNGKTVSCDSCKEKEAIELAIVREVEEYKLLFPNEKITTNSISTWCSNIVSKKTVHRILTKNFQINGHGKYSFYTET